MRPWGSFSRQCEAFYSNAARGTAAARRSASSRSKIEVAREEHDENVKWAKQPDARRVLEQPRFDAENNGEGTSADEGALESLDAHLKARQWHHPAGGPARRFLSHFLTYPLTLASGVREAGLGSFSAPVASSGQRETFAPSAAHESNNTGNSSSDGGGGRALAIVCLGARAESTMPPAFWREALFALPGVSHFSLHLIGPELGVPPGVAAGPGQQGGQPTTGRDGESKSGRDATCSLSSTATHATVLLVGGRTLEVGWTRAVLGRAAAGEEEQEAVGSVATAAAAATAAAEKAVADADAFVLFNPGLGHPHLRRGWAGALERLLDTGKPIVVSCHSEKDLERDASLLRGAGAVRCCPDQAIASEGKGKSSDVLPRENAFRSLMVSEDPLSTLGEVVSCNWGIVVVRGIGAGEGKSR